MEEKALTSKEMIAKIKAVLDETKEKFEKDLQGIDADPELDATSKRMLKESLIVTFDIVSSMVAIAERVEDDFIIQYLLWIADQTLIGPERWDMLMFASRKGDELTRKIAGAIDAMKSAEARKEGKLQ